jgi:hypothetical protein
VLADDPLDHGGLHHDQWRVRGVLGAVDPYAADPGLNEAELAQRPAVVAPHGPIDAFVGVAERCGDGRPRRRQEDDGHDGEDAGRHGALERRGPLGGDSRGHLFFIGHAVTVLSRGAVRLGVVSGLPEVAAG